MPSGRTHDRITYLSLPLIAGLAYLFTHQPDLTVIVTGGYFFSGLMFGPDLDIYSIQYKRWGIFRWLWLPYQSHLKHRSFLSHGFLIGTILRLLYLGTILSLAAIPILAISQLLGVFTWNWQNFRDNTLSLFLNQYFDQAIALFIGLELGAMSHSISDHVGTWLKRSQNKNKKKDAKKQTNKRKNSRKRY
ncbi:metal-binding protein [Aphanothece sacrum]|uniref:Hydrolase n=1 Tax=Aphanothece sacrum FPU1 TaxID=1920663 RepID=A0A401IKD2_APHSA|nr:metal-binding protein [Aphanothece sacrum]GBF81686.1 hydrolase [Aphanothece sacrum FPU1]GBF84055.1 hydrolase [Aphanothece sacrum FPU3]